MTPPGSEFRIRTNPVNPGEFLACCGILELADRLFEGAEGHFSDPTAFVVKTRGTLRFLLETLLAHEAREILSVAPDVPIKPLIAPLALRLLPAVGQPFELVLDSWVTVRMEKGGPAAVANRPWNFWSGQQTSLRIWASLRAALLSQLARLPEHALEQPFAHRVPLSGRFGFDPGAAWNALDAGFSPNDQQIEVASSPAVELLAAVGLQRFRPALSADRSSFDYAAWEVPLAPAVAAAVAATACEGMDTQRFRGRVVSRGSYAALAYSTIVG